MKILYVVYIRTAVVRKCIDVMRLLSNPCEKRSAHITVRGPYGRYKDFSRHNTTVEYSVISVDGFGSFFEGRQNTVYFKCNSPVLERIWFKKDYAFNPHITIYDGDSREFATELLELLANYQWDFGFQPTRIVPLVTNNGQYSIDLPLDVDWFMVSRSISHETTDLESIRKLDPKKRLKLIAAVAQLLSSSVWVKAIGGVFQPRPPTPSRTIRKVGKT